MKILGVPFIDVPQEVQECDSQTGPLGKRWVLYLAAEH